MTLETAGPFQDLLAVNDRLRAEFALVRALREEKRRERKYNPNWFIQPRAPKGTHEGGRWIEGAPDGAQGTAKQGSGRRPGPRHNVPPPDSLYEIFPGLPRAPASAVLAPIDTFLGITWPGNAANEAATEMMRDTLIAQIRSIDPSYRFSTLDPGGMPSTYEGRAQLINNLRADRAAIIFRVRGEAGPLQVETLRFLQRRTDAAYDEALQLARRGRLPIRLSREEAIGNFIDARVRQELRAFLHSRNISTVRGQLIRVNSREYNTSEARESYRIPDSRVGNIAFDVTIRPKDLSNSQVRGYFAADFRPAAVIIVRPSQLGRNSTYLITRPSQR